MSFRADSLVGSFSTLDARFNLKFSSVRSNNHRLSDVVPFQSCIPPDMFAIYYNYRVVDADGY